ncbi:MULTISPECIES: hypothetical protein [Sphingobacterium]|jgi:hypothetical protein|uniref:Outer membrane protein beta-barrel domain-containing protein n=1 Tax=Sphingobacterium litopenaei TaxID=2763500 RepID=A0ABR7YDP3_9SPHI|nr:MULTISPECIES: hypothetical protein [Sphingobacterium]MBD1429343.1 hypothetical protein [Sphingobacterium litopenaei]NGM71944.1 hypothetical protein [Sphingobacterium sp. SGL-16]
MTKYFTLIACFFFAIQYSFAQNDADTIHYRKIYYFAGTGLALPIGKTKEVLSPKLFAGSMGLDISLKNSKYYLYPALYMFNFDYDQKIEDNKYNHLIENGNASIYMLSLAGGTRKQMKRLNTYVYGGPSFGLVNEPRAQKLETTVKIDYDRSFAIGAKVGVGADYKFKSFFLGGELGYMRHFTKVQGRPFHAMTLLFGLKSDITRLGEKVVEIIAPSSN